MVPTDLVFELRVEVVDPKVELGQRRRDVAWLRAPARYERRSSIGGSIGAGRGAGDDRVGELVGVKGGAEERSVLCAKGRKGKGRGGKGSELVGWGVSVRGGGGERGCVANQWLDQTELAWVVLVKAF